MTPPKFERDWIVPATIVTFLAIVATLGFRAVFSDFTFVATATIGAVGATACAVTARALRLHLPESILLGLGGFLALGAIATKGVPTGAAYRAFFDGLINGWARVLTSVPPATYSAANRALPYTIAWLSAMIGIEILRTRRLALAVIGPLIGLALTSLIALEDRRVALAQGAVLAVGMLALGWLQQRRQARSVEVATSDGAAYRRRSRRALGTQVGSAIAMASLAAVIAVYVGPRLPDVNNRDRFDLRQLQTPPFDPLNVPTPLGQVKVGLQQANADRVMFTVTSAEPIDRFTLAVLDNYNDEYWLVGDETTTASAQFRPVDERLPQPVNGSVDGWQRVSATIEIDELGQLANGEFRPPWVPSPGWPVRITSDPPLDLRFNVDTGTLAAAPNGLEAGTSYTIVADVAPPVDRLSLANATVTPTEPIDLVAPQLRSFAADTFEGADFGWQQVEAVRQRLVDTGAYDSRPQRATARAGHNLGRLAEFVSNPDQIAGFEEQYAAAAAALLRSEGVPVRVVVGFVIPQNELVDRRSGNTTPVLADDISAWIEVKFDDIGWVPFDVTPPRDRVPSDTPIGKTERQVAEPEPPPEPPPPVEPNRLDQSSADDDTSTTDESEPTSSAVPWRTVAIAGAVSLPFVLIFGAIVVIVSLKRRRTLRRRAAASPATRIAGAWYEVIDRCREQGAPPRRAATTLEIARGLRDAELVDDHEGTLLVALACDVDRAAFAAEEPAESDADEAWAIVDTVTGGVARRQPLLQRWRTRLDPRPLMEPDPVQRSYGEKTDE